VARFASRGFDVLIYDSRAHGESAGDFCTYGFFEKHDLHRVLDMAAPGPIVLFGASLGAAVALQEAAIDERVTAVVAAETFSDLRTVATERAPFFFPDTAIRQAFELAERRARFQVDAVSPVAAAAAIKVPVLLVHGAEDRDTPPDHSRRVYRALAGPKRLILVPGARHNESLRPEVWSEIERWIESTLIGSGVRPTPAIAERYRTRTTTRRFQGSLTPLARSTASGALTEIAAAGTPRPVSTPATLRARIPPMSRRSVSVWPLESRVAAR
jgi:pimeloyl-ACP methyl ester carboxylesterase